MLHLNSLLLEVFDDIRRNVAGDISKPQLGLSSADRILLSERVNIVIHAAATVRFDEPINVAVAMNTLGTQQIMNLCTTMMKLKVN